MLFSKRSSRVRSRHESATAGVALAASSLAPARLRARIRARLLVAALVAVSWALATAAPANSAAPYNVSPPVIGGNLVEGARATAHPGTWEGLPALAYTYQWQRCANAASGELCRRRGSGAGVSADDARRPQVAADHRNRYRQDWVRHRDVRHRRSCLLRDRHDPRAAKPHATCHLRKSGGRRDARRLRGHLALIAGNDLHVPVAAMRWPRWPDGQQHNEHHSVC